MAQVLDSIIKRRMIEGPVTIDSLTLSQLVDMSGVENSFSIQLDYEEGIGLSANLSLEVSVNGRDFSEIPNSIQNITDATGTHIWDLVELGTNYIRVKIDVVSGSFDISEVVFSGKRRH